MNEFKHFLEIRADKTEDGSYRRLTRAADKKECERKKIRQKRRKIMYRRKVNM